MKIEVVNAVLLRWRAKKSVSLTEDDWGVVLHSLEQQMFAETETAINLGVKAKVALRIKDVKDSIASQLKGGQ